MHYLVKLFILKIHRIEQCFENFETKNGSYKLQYVSLFISYRCLSHSQQYFSSV